MAEAPPLRCGSSPNGREAESEVRERSSASVPARADLTVGVSVSSLWTVRERNLERNPVYEPTPEQATAEEELRDAASERKTEERRHRERVTDLVNRCDRLGIPRTRIADAAQVQRSALYAEYLSA